MGTRTDTATDHNGKTTQYAYDTDDRLTSVLDAASNLTQYTGPGPSWPSCRVGFHDTEDNLITITDADDGANILVGLSITVAFLPLAVMQAMESLNLDLHQWGGALMNPINGSAIAWLIITTACYRRLRTKSAALLFAMFPVAFSASAILTLFWLWAVYGHSK
ncbi:MAG: RHS repeat domain-containing protein [Terriglobales bacterium]